MKILHRNQLTESAPVARQQLSGDRSSRASPEKNGARGEATRNGDHEFVSRKSTCGPSPASEPGARPSVVLTTASPACTRLNVAPRSSRGTSEEAYAPERLALTTRVPTLVVQAPARILAWLRGRRALRVLCAHDLTSAADEALRLVRQLSEIGRCEITLAHVHRSVEQVSHPGCVGVGSMRKHDLEMRSLLEEKLQERARTVFGDQPVTTRVSSAPFRRDDFILDVIRETDADLVVAPIHPYAEAGTSLSTATSRTLLCFAEANLILVPPALLPAARPKNVVRRALVVAELTPTDARVLAQARALLSPGGTLRVLHVLHPNAAPDTAYDRSPSFRSQVPDHIRLEESSRKRLRTLAQKDANAAGTAAESEVVEHRDRALAIAHAAESFDADIVCLALAERPNFLTRLCGSQIRRLLTQARRSLLIVQPTPA